MIYPKLAFGSIARLEPKENNLSSTFCEPQHYLRRRLTSRGSTYLWDRGAEVGIGLAGSPTSTLPPDPVDHPDLKL